MSKKRVIATMLAAAMVTGSLAGCGQSSGNVSEAATGSSQKTEETTDAGSELKTIKIMGVDRSITDSAGNTVYLSDWVNGDSKIWEKFTSELAARGLALELDLIAGDQYPTVLQTSIAAGLDCDMVNITSLDANTREQLVERGELLAVNQIREEYSNAETVDFYTNGYGSEVARLNTMEDGNEYWVSAITIGDYAGESWGGFAGSMIRWDWLEKLGLELPETTEELFDVLKAFQEKDANGDGMPNEVANAGMEGFYNGIAQMFGLGVSSVYVDYETGKATSPWYQDSIKDYISYMKRLNEAGLLDTSGQSGVLNAENKISLTLGWWIETWVEPTITVGEGQEAPYLVGLLCDAENGSTPLIARQNGIQKTNYDFAITSQADKEAIGILFDYLASEEYSVLTEFGIEGYTYDVVDGVKVKRTDSDISEVQIMSMGFAMWTADSILPRYEIVDRVQELETCEEMGYSVGREENGYKEKAAIIKNVYENPDDYSYAYMSIDGNIAVATSEQTEKIAELSTDFETYSSELLTNLILGEKSMDDWDSYIAEMKELGLDELIAITQERYNRAKQ